MPKQKQHRQADSKKRRLSVQSVDPEKTDLMFERLKKKIKSYSEKMGISIRTLFRQIDADGDRFIDVQEFKLACQDYFDMAVLTKQENSALLKAVFKRFDTNGDWLIWMEEFVSTLAGNLFSQLDVKELLAKMRKDIDIEEDSAIEKEFETMQGKRPSAHKGLVDFDNFKTYVRQNYSKSYLDKRKEDAEMLLDFLFYQFAGEDKQGISLSRFTSLLREEYLNIKNIKRKLNEYMQTNKFGTIEDVIAHYSASKGNYLKMKDLTRLINDAGIEIEGAQMEELFDQIDTQKNEKIDQEELEKFLSD